MTLNPSENSVPEYRPRGRGQFSCLVIVTDVSQLARDSISAAAKPAALNPSRGRSMLERHDNRNDRYPDYDNQGNDPFQNLDLGGQCPHILGQSA